MSTSKEFTDLANAFIADPTNWPAAMAARTLRMAAGHAPYSPTNQALILAQLAGRYLRKGGDEMVALQAAIADATSEIAPRAVWARRGFTPAGGALRVWSKPFKLHVDENGDRVPADTPGAKLRTVYKMEHTYVAGDVRDSEGNDALEAFAVPPLTDGAPVKVFADLVAWIEAQGWQVRRGDTNTTANGYTLHAGKQIVVHAGLDGWAAVETLVHEIAHAILHGADDPRSYQEHRGVIEAEAESVAFGVLMSLGQAELAKGSVRYATEWADRDTKVLAVAYERACHVTDALCRVIKGEADVEVAVSAKAEKLQASASNKVLAAQLREAGLVPSGAVWAQAKAGVPIDDLLKLAA